MRDSVKTEDTRACIVDDFDIREEELLNNPELKTAELGEARRAPVDRACKEEIDNELFKIRPHSKVMIRVDTKIRPREEANTAAKISF